MKTTPYLSCFPLLFLLFLFGIQEPVFSQLIVPEGDRTVRHTLSLSMGLEPEWVATLGYRHRLSSQQAPTPFYLGGSLKIAPLLLSQGAWRANFTQSVERSLSESWKGVLHNEFYLVHNRNRAGSMHGLGIDLRSAMLHYGGTWTKGIELGWQHTALTHIRHSEESREAFRDRYPDGGPGEGPANGWYGHTANRLSFGLLSRHHLGQQWALQLGLGSQFSYQKQGILLGFSHAQVPLYFRTQLLYGK